MQNQESQQNIELMTNYLSGHANADDVKRLEAFVGLSSENKKLFTSIKKAWMLSGMADGAVVDIDKAWSETARQVFNQHHVVPLKPHNNRRQWLSLAASIVILAMASFLIYKMANRPGGQNVRTTANSELITLKDGTQITLNHSSSLLYKPNKDNAQRLVELSGDAFFDVARDESTPFIVQTDQVEIEVLGTSFYVDARSSEKEVQVIVESGRVAVRTGQSESIINAGEKVVFRKIDGQLIKQVNTDPNFNALKTKTLIFDNSPLEDVVFALNRHFRAQITIKNEALKSCELTSTFKDKSLSAIVAIIKTSLGIDAKQTKNKIIFEGNCTLK